MKNRLEKLFTVKSIVTILLSITFAIMSLTAMISSEQFNTIYTVIIGFYFGTQAVKE